MLDKLSPDSDNGFIDFILLPGLRNANDCSNQYKRNGVWEVKVYPNEIIEGQLPRAYIICLYT